MFFIKHFRQYFPQVFVHYSFNKNFIRYSSNINNPALKVTEGCRLENLGQPAPWSHPHILKNGEVIRGINLEEIKDRRCKLLHDIKKFTVNSNAKLQSHVVIIPSSTKQYMSDKIPYVFRQNSDFLYLSGCLEPDSVLVLIIDEKDATKSMLFMRPKDKQAELWDGPRTGVDNSIDFFGVDEAYNVEQLMNILQSHIVTKQAAVTVWCDKKACNQKNVTDAVNTVTFPHNIKVESPTNFVHKLRVIKSPAEVQLMRKTCQIASESINETMMETRPGDSEHHVFARVDYKCRMRDASYLAYPPVVAAGRNATTIHYINNSQVINKSDLILMDAGCEYGGYTSDITRTWPASGSFTPVQKILYDLVLTLQKDLLDCLLKHGGRTLDELFDTMCFRLGKYLQEIGLIPKELNDNALARAAYTFCPHHVSHYLGMDVHDTPLISRSTNLQPGMICTVEPGIYISTERKDVPEEFRGFGLRVEDDVYIKSQNSIENLTESCVKDRDSLEELLKR